MLWHNALFCNVSHALEQNALFHCNVSQPVLWNRMLYSSQHRMLYSSEYMYIIWFELISNQLLTSTRNVDAPVAFGWMSLRAPILKDPDAPVPFDLMSQHALFEHHMKSTEPCWADTDVHGYRIIHMSKVLRCRMQASRTYISWHRWQQLTVGHVP